MFRDLAPGKYRFFAEVHNLIRTNIAVAEVYPDKPAFVELKIQPLTPFVRGQILTTEGVPVQNAKIELVMAEGWNAIFETRSDEKGNFEARNLPAGLYYVIAGAEGRAKVFAGKFNFEPGKGQEGIRIVLPKAATIVGKVIALKGKSLPTYAYVSTTEPNVDRYSPADGNLTNAFARVKGDGSYRLMNLAPGTYTIRLVVGGEVVDKVTVTVKEGETVVAPDLKVK